MSEHSDQLSYQIEPDEKATPVMVYTATNIVWGEVVTKQAIRVSTWLRTNTAPDSVRVYNAKVLLTTAPLSTPRPMSFPELHIAIPLILAFHLQPPEKDPVDYDPTEPNRRMDPVTVLVSTFRMDGFIRVSMVSNLAKYLEITRESFTGIYDVEISNSLLPYLGIIRVPYVLVHKTTSIFTTRQGC